jgi:hypothetical protein
VRNKLGSICADCARATLPQYPSILRFSGQQWREPEPCTMIGFLVATAVVYLLKLGG